MLIRNLIKEQNKEGMKRILFLTAALLTIGLAISCKTKDAPAHEAETDDWGDEFYEQPSSTSPEVAEWLKTVSIDSAERVLCRHNGYVELGDTSVMVWFSDVLRCCTEAAMDYPFEELEAAMEMTMMRSADGRLRVFYWNTGMGGTCPDIARYTLLRAADGSIHLLEDGHDSPQLLDIYELKSRRGETVYLLHEYYREWSTYGAAWAWCCRVDGNRLDTLAVFPHGEKAVGVEYNIPGWYFTANDGEGWDWLFDLEGDDLYVPVVIGDGITDRYDLYRWDGQRFDSIGNVGNHRLHASLRDYNELASYFVTKGFRVRIDQMGGDSYRYASWPRSKETAANPDLVIEGGRYDEKNSCFVFENDGYVYRVGDITYAVGDKEWKHEGLVVEKGGKVLLCQEKE